MRRAVAALLLLAASGPATARAQTWRTLDASRQLRDSGDVRVQVRYGLGRLELRPATEPVLYAMHLRYDEDLGAPIHRYDAGDRSLTLGMGKQSLRFGRNMDERNGGEMRLQLSPRVPIDLDVDVGAARATLDLSGLSIQRLRLEAGASEARLEFDVPNPVRMKELDLHVGAAAFTARRLGNANTNRIRVQSGVGSVDLDLGGAWTQDVDVDVNVALGKTTLHVPREVGVRLEVQKFLATVDHEGLVRRGDAYYSDNWETARYRVRVRVHTAFGGIEIDRR